MTPTLDVDRAVRPIPTPAWWALRGLATGHVQPREASAVASLLRVLHALGPEPMDEEEALAEVELRGIIMAGLQPRNEAEWALARRRFSEEALQLLGRPEPDDDEDWDEDDEYRSDGVSEWGRGGRRVGVRGRAGGGPPR